MPPMMASSPQGRCGTSQTGVGWGGTPTADGCSGIMLEGGSSGRGNRSSRRVSLEMGKASQEKMRSSSPSGPTCPETSWTAWEVMQKDIPNNQEPEETYGRQRAIPVEIRCIG